MSDPRLDATTPDDGDRETLPAGTEVVPDDERETDPGVEDAPVDEEGPSFAEHERDVREAVEQGSPDGFAHPGNYL